MRAAAVCAGWWLRLAALTMFAQSAAGQSQPVEVMLFSPVGTMRDVRQVTARFSEPMVTLGDPRLPDPFEVQCPAGGQGRWADARNWVYDFDADLPAGLRCAFVLRKDLRSAAGRELSGQRSFGFDTGGPSIKASYPQDGWTAIDEQQVFLLKLAAPATAVSIAAHAHCVVAGIEEQIGVEVLTGAARAAVLKVRRSLGYQYFRLLWKQGQVDYVRLRHDALDQAESLISVVRCRRPLPSQTHRRQSRGCARVPA